MENVELYETMRNLPKQYSEVLILHYVNGLTGKERAELLEMKESAVMKENWLGTDMNFPRDFTEK